MSFLEGLIESFKILIVGGIIAIAFVVWYVNYIAAKSLADFSAYIFGAMLLGLLFAFGVTLLLMNKSKNL